MPKRPEFARTLRGTMTDAERALWFHLRAKRFQGWKFRRQQPIGHYIVDFVVSRRAWLSSSTVVSTRKQDVQRTAWLESQGFRVLRFWNDLVLTRMDDVLEEILRHSPPLSHKGRGVQELELGWAFARNALRFATGPLPTLRTAS